MNTADQSARAEVRGTQAKQPTLRVALFPYLPRPEQFKRVLLQAWGETEPPLKFVEYNSYHQDPDDLPAELRPDVFVFDNMLLPHLVQNLFLRPLQAPPQDSTDFLPFTLGACSYQGALYGLPAAACSHVYFYRDGDRPLDKKDLTLEEFHLIIGDNPTPHQIKPAKGLGLLLDLFWPIESACLYFTSYLQSRKQDYPGALHPPLPPMYTYDATALDNLGQLVAMAGKAQAAFRDTATDAEIVGDYSPAVSHKRREWFSEGLGRAYVAYPELLCYFELDPLLLINLRPLPVAATGTGRVAHVDMAGINWAIEPYKVEVAEKLVALMTSTEVVYQSLIAEPHHRLGQNPQYILPARTSVLDRLVGPDNNNDRLYRQMKERVVPQIEIALQLGTGSRTWLRECQEDLKKVILS